LFFFYEHPCAVYGSTLKYLLRLRDRFILILFAMFALIWFLLHFSFVLTTNRLASINLISLLLPSHYFYWHFWFWFSCNPKTCWTWAQNTFRM